MILTEENKEEAIKVLRFLEVDEETIKYIKCTDEANWIHKFEGHLGGRDGWPCLVIDRGPDFELDDEISDEYEHIIVDGVEYIICEGD
jgi:hypothetical protein